MDTKDFASPLMLYSRPHAGAEILVGSGDTGDPVADPDGGTGDIPMDWVAEVGTASSSRPWWDGCWRRPHWE